MPKEWFSVWFDSPYYHLLYRQHDEQEARQMLDNLLSTLSLPPGARVLDLACGKGRHSRYLAERGFDVTGLDISEQSIAYARQFENEHLHFYQHDMRKLFISNYFDAVLNLFTSFGYFKNEADHVRTLTNVVRGLRPGGLLLLDFFNARYVRNHLVPADEKTTGGITFHLRRRVEAGLVVKNIEFNDHGQQFSFEERVHLFELPDFQILLGQAGLVLQKTFGGYNLEPFNADTSKRLILVAQKPLSNA